MHFVSNGIYERKIYKTQVKHRPLALMLLRSVIFISIFGNMCGLWGLLFLT